MLVLSRKPGEKLCIGNDIVLTVAGVKGNQVRLAIAAPPETRVLRSELVFDAGEHFERAQVSQRGGVRCLSSVPEDAASPAKG